MLFDNNKKDRKLGNLSKGVFERRASTNYTSLLAKTLEKLAERDIITASRQENMPGARELNKFNFRPP